MSRPIRYKNIVCCDSEYSLFLYFLVTEYKIDDSLFVFSQRLNQLYRKKFQGNGIYLKTYRGSSRFVAALVNAFYYVWVVLKLYHKRAIKLPAYGFDFLQFSAPIIKCSSSFNLVEDGLSNYEKPNLILRSLKRSKIKRFLFKKRIYYPGYGISDAVKKIYLTSLQPIPDSIKDKVEVINISYMWNSLSVTRKEEILSFFLGDIDLPHNDNRCLILTQCWSEYNIMTERQKIDIYQKIIDIVKSTNRYEDIMLKVHPAETTDYSLYYDGVTILKYPIPIQVLELLNYKFSTIITINSTAIYTSECDHKIQLLEEHIENSRLYEYLLERLMNVIL